MKKAFTILISILLTTQVIAQVNTPKIIGIVMIGKSGKPILDIYILDSTKRDEFNFDVHTIILHTDKATLDNIYSEFPNVVKYDSIIKFDKSFGTFLFSFRFQNGEKTKVIANRLPSAVLFQKIISKLSSANKNEEIITALKENLSRINY